MVMGGLQTLDGLSFLMNYGSEINVAYSYLEMIWFVACLVFVFILHSANRHQTLPILYMSYITTNVWLASQFFEPAAMPPGYEVPAWFCWITISTGVLLLFFAVKEYRLTEP